MRFIILNNMINRVCKNLRKNYRLLFTDFKKFSVQKELINAPSSKYTDHLTELKENIWRDVDVTGKVPPFLA